MTARFSHLDHHNFIRAIEKEFAEHPELAAGRGDWEEILEMARKKGQASHTEATMVMHDFQVTRRPFVLFLRSFEVEAYDYLTPEAEGGAERQMFTTLSGPGSVEKKLFDALDGRVLLIGVANPSDLLQRGLTPRLQLPADGWQRVVEQLIQFAHFIVMDCDHLAPGVRWELETIQKLGRQDDTVVVLPPSDIGTDNTLRELAEIAGADAIDRWPASEDDPRLAPFSRTTREDAIRFDRLEESPAFAALLSTALANTAETPPFDAENHATWLNNQGVERFNEKEWTEALNLY